MWCTIGRGNIWKGEIRNQAKDGSYYWVDTTIVPIKDEDGNPMQYISIRFDMTDKKRSEERIRFMAYYDHLTGLPNRRMFDQNLIKTIERAKENNTKFGTLFIDLDSFKYVNDTLGHLIGDKLLIEVSKRFKKIIDDRGMVARLSGDEFAIIVYAISNLELQQAAPCGKDG